jgi:hypothetical protein
MVERSAVQPAQVTLRGHVALQRWLFEHCPFDLNGRGQLFQALQLHLRTPTLLVDLYALLLFVVMVGLVAAANRASRLQEPAPLVAGLIGMHTALASQFADWLQVHCGFQSRLELERGTMMSAFLGHRFVPPLAQLIIVPFHLNQ